MWDCGEECFVLSDKNSVRHVINQKDGGSVLLPVLEVPEDKVDDTLVKFVVRVVKLIDNSIPKVDLDEVENVAIEKFHSMDKNFRVRSILVNTKTNLKSKYTKIIKHEYVEPNLAICVTFPEFFGTAIVGGGKLAAYITEPKYIVSMKIA